MKTIKTPCPCGSGKHFDACCEPYLSGAQVAPTAEKLMRSRYSAYSLSDSAYVFRTWHPDTRPQLSDLQQNMSQIKWRGLRVLNTRLGQAKDSEGWVSFQARYKPENKPAEKLKENSYFQRFEGLWVYVDSA